MGDLLARFKDHLVTLGISDGSIRNYLSDLNHFQNWLSSSYPKQTFSDINSEHPLAYRTYLVHELEAPVSSVNRRLSSLRQFFTWAVSQNILPSHPMQGLSNISIRAGNTEVTPQKFQSVPAPLLTPVVASTPTTGSQRPRKFPVKSAAIALLTLVVLTLASLNAPNFLSGRMMTEILTVFHTPSSETTLDPETTFVQEITQNKRLDTLDKSTQELSFDQLRLQEEQQSTRDFAINTQGELKNFDSTTENSIQNSSFELNAYGTPEKWQYFNFSSGSNTVVTQDGAHTGGNVLKFSLDGVKYGGLAQLQSKSRSDSESALSVWVRGSGLSYSGLIKLGFKDDTGKYAAYQDFYLGGSFGWQRLTVSANAQGLYPAIEFRGYTLGTAYLDDWQMTRGRNQVKYAENKSSGQGSVETTGQAEIFPVLGGSGSLGTTLSRFGALYLSGATIDTLGNVSISGTTISKNIKPLADKAYDLGSSSYYYRSIYAQSLIADGTTISGDQTILGNLMVSGTTTLMGLLTSNGGITTNNASINAGSGPISGGSIAGATLTTTGNTSVGGALSVSSTLNTNVFNATSLIFSGGGPVITVSSLNSGISLEASGTGLINIGAVSTGDINIGGGFGSTGCTIFNSSGNLTCTGDILGAATGTVGYWTRAGTTLSPATSGDSVTTSGNISSTGSGTVTSAGLLTASNGLTLSTGALNLTSTSGSISLIAGVANASLDIKADDTLRSFTLSNTGADTVAAGTPEAKLVVKGGTNQAGNMVELQNSAGTVLAKFAANGDLTLGPTGNGKITVGVVDPYLITNTGTFQSALEFRNTATAGADDFVFTLGGAERARLTETGNLTIVGTLTAQSTSTSTFAGSIDMQNNVILNIGNAGTDFVATTGALNLAGVLSANGGITLGASQTFSATSGIISATGLSSSTISTTSSNLTLSTATSGTLALTSAGALNLSAGAASTVTLVNVANALNFDADTLSIDALNNRVGIGTTSPTNKLTVSGGDIRLDNARNLNFRDGANTTDWNILSVNSSNSTTLYGPSFLNLNSSSNQIRANANTIISASSGLNPASMLDVVGGVSIGTYGGANAAPSNGMIVSGNVGIGTTTPGSKLEVNGTTRLGGSASAASFTVDNNLMGSTTGLAKWAFSGASGEQFSIFTNGTAPGNERLRVDASGNVGIGTTAPLSGGLTNALGAYYFYGASGGVDQKVWDIQQNAGANVLQIRAINDANTAATQALVFNRGAGIAISSVAFPNGNVGIGTTGPSEKLEVENGNVLLDHSNLKLTPELSPGAPTVAINAVAGNLNGAYTYKITFVTASGETQGGTTSASVSPVNQQVNLTAIPTGTAGFVTARKIYRTAAAGADGTQKLVTTLADNITTTYTDNIADASLGATVSKANSTANIQVTATENLYLFAGAGKAVVVGDGTGKITAGLFDPAYKIDGINYSTYAPSMLGVKEEITGSVTLIYDPANNNYSYTLDLANQPQGSDLWVFSRISDPDVNLTAVLVSANFSSRVWYLKDAARRSVTIFSDRGGEVSYRLTAPRFDHLKWNTLSEDQTTNGLTPLPTQAPVGGEAGNLSANGYFGAFSENFNTVGTVTAGDLLSVDQVSSGGKLTRSQGAYDAKLTGVATSGGPVATVTSAGRVQVRASIENGNIAPGDHLTSSATKPGLAMKATQAGRTIGVALQPLSGADGTILVSVLPNWFDPAAPIYNPNGTVAPTSSSTTATYDTLTATTANITNLNVGGIAIVADPSGNLKINGNVLVTGTGTFAEVRVNGLLTLMGGISAPSGLAVNLGLSKAFELKNSAGETVASISDQGALIARSAEVSELKVSTVSAQPTTGVAIFRAGGTSMLIETTKITATSKVIVTFKGNYAPATRYWTSDEVSGQSFTLHLDQAPTSDVSFNWWIIN